MEDTAGSDRSATDAHGVDRVVDGGGGGVGPMVEAQIQDERLIDPDKLKYDSLFSNDDVIGRPPFEASIIRKDDVNALGKCFGENSFSLIHRGFPNPFDPSKLIIRSCKVSISGRDGEVGIAFESSGRVYGMTYADFLASIPSNCSDPKLLNNLRRKYPTEASKESKSRQSAARRQGNKSKEDVEEVEETVMFRCRDPKRALNFTSVPKGFDVVISDLSDAMSAFVDDLLTQCASAFTEAMKKSLKLMGGILVYVGGNMLQSAVGEGLIDLAAYIDVDALYTGKLSNIEETRATFEAMLRSLHEFLTENRVFINSMKSLCLEGRGDRRAVQGGARKSDSDSDRLCESSDDDAEDPHFSRLHILGNIRGLLDALRAVRVTIAKHVVKEFSGRFVTAFTLDESNEEAAVLESQQHTDLRTLMSLFDLLLCIDEVCNYSKDESAEEKTARFIALKFIPCDLVKMLSYVTVVDIPESKEIEKRVKKLSRHVIKRGVDTGSASRGLSAQLQSWQVIIGGLRSGNDIPSREELLAFLVDVCPDEFEADANYRAAMDRIRGVMAASMAAGKSDKAAQRRKGKQSERSDAQPVDAKAGDDAVAEGDVASAMPDGGAAVTSSRKTPSRLLRELDVVAKSGTPDEFDCAQAERGKRQSKQKEMFKPTMGPLKQKKARTFGLDIDGLKDCTQASPLEGVFGPCVKDKDLCGAVNDPPTPSLGIVRNLDYAPVQCCSCLSLALPTGHVTFVRVLYPKADCGSVYQECLVEADLIYTEKITSCQILCCRANLDISPNEQIILMNGKTSALNALTAHRKANALEKMLRPLEITPGTEYGVRPNPDGTVKYPSEASRKLKEQFDQQRALGGAPACDMEVISSEGFDAAAGLLSRPSKGKGAVGRSERGDTTSFTRRGVRISMPKGFDPFTFFRISASNKIIPYPGFYLLSEDPKVRRAVQLVPMLIDTYIQKENYTTSCSLLFQNMYQTDPVFGIPFKYQLRHCMQNPGGAADASDTSKIYSCQEAWVTIADMIMIVDNRPSSPSASSFVDACRAARCSGEDGGGGEDGCGGEDGGGGEDGIKDNETDKPGSGSEAVITCDMQSMRVAMDFLDRLSCVNQLHRFVYLVVDRKSSGFRPLNTQLDRGSLKQYAIILLPVDQLYDASEIGMIKDIFEGMGDMHNMRFFGPVEVRLSSNHGGVSMKGKSFREMIDLMEKGLKHMRTSSVSLRRFISSVHELEYEDFHMYHIGQLCRNKENPFDHCDGLCRAGWGYFDTPIDDMYKIGLLKRGGAPYLADLYTANAPLCHCMCKPLEGESDYIDTFQYELKPFISSFYSNDNVDGKARRQIARNILTGEYTHVCFRVTQKEREDDERERVREIEKAVRVRKAP